MRNHKFTVWVRLFAAAMLTLGPGMPSSQAQPAPDKNWPAKPIRLIVPFAAGGGTDVAARAVAAKLGERLGQAVIVDNRPGGKGVIAYEAALREPPDGYTFLFNNSSHSVQAAYKKLPYNLVGDFTPVSMVGLASVVLAVAPSFPAKNLGEFLTWVRKNPGKVSYGSYGAGTTGHLWGEVLNSAAKIDLLHIAYKGSGPAVTDLMGGHIQAVFIDSIAARNLALSGKIRILALTGGKRWAAFPDVPTFGELGYPDLAVPGWWGLLATKKTPPDIVNRLALEIKKVVATPDTAKRLNDLGAEAYSNTPAEFAAALVPEMAQWKKIVKEKNIPLD